MRNIDMTNPLIQGYRKAKGEAPMPNDFPDFNSFLVAHRNNLRKLRVQNKKDLGKLFNMIRGNHRTDGKTYMFAYLTKIIHFRKEYDAYLVRGIDATTRFLNRGF